MIRTLEIVGQVVRDLDTQWLASSLPDIPWTKIAGMRNVLAHQYLGVGLNLVWNIVAHDLQAVAGAVADLLARETKP